MESFELRSDDQVRVCAGELTPGRIAVVIHGPDKASIPSIWTKPNELRALSLVLDYFADRLERTRLEQDRDNPPTAHRGAGEAAEQ